MFGNLAGLLAARPNGGLLCLFGDHVPSMPAVYEALGFADPRTDYLIWPDLGRPRGQVDLEAHQLPEVLLGALAGGAALASRPEPDPGPRSILGAQAAAFDQAVVPALGVFPAQPGAALADPLAAGSFTYSYDALGRLTQANLAGRADIAYRYDPAGNRSSGLEALTA